MLSAAATGSDSRGAVVLGETGSCLRVGVGAGVLSTGGLVVTVEGEG